MRTGSAKQSAAAAMSTITGMRMKARHWIVFAVASWAMFGVSLANAVNPTLRSLKTWPLLGDRLDQSAVGAAFGRGVKAADALLVLADR